MFAVVRDTAVVGDVGKFYTKRCVSGARPPPLGSAHFSSIFQILPVGGVRLWPGV